MKDLLDEVADHHVYCSNVVVAVRWEPAWKGRQEEMAQCACLPVPVVLPYCILLMGFFLASWEDPNHDNLP